MRSPSIYIQIVPTASFLTTELFNLIFDAVKNPAVNNPWKIKHFKNPERFNNCVKPFITLNDPLYKNLGYLDVINCDDHIKVQFLQPRYGIETSYKIIAFLFNEFIHFIKSKLSGEMKDISILDHSPVFLIHPPVSLPSLHIFINPQVIPEELGQLLLKALASPIPSFSPIPYYINDPAFSVLWDPDFRNIRTVKLNQAYDNIKLLFQPISSSWKLQKRVSLLAILYTFYIHYNFNKSTDGMRLSFPLQSD